MNYLNTTCGTRIAAHAIDVIHPPLCPVGGQPFDYQVIEYHVGRSARETTANVCDVEEFLELESDRE